MIKSNDNAVSFQEPPFHPPTHPAPPWGPPREMPPAFAHKGKIFVIGAEPPKSKRGRIRRALKLAAKWFCFSVFMVAVFSLFFALCVRAIGIEADWREERLCRIYEVCDPKAGP